MSTLPRFLVGLLATTGLTTTRLATTGLAIAGLSVAGLTSAGLNVAGAQGAQETATIPILVGARGGDAPRAVDPLDVRVTVGGTASASEIVPADNRLVTLYLDAGLSSKGTLQRAADRMISALSPLLDEAEFEIVVADPTPRVLLPATQQPQTARNALDRVFLTLDAEDAIERLRQGFRTTETRQQANPAEVRQARLDSAEAETRALRRQHDQLVLWMDQAQAEPGQDRVLVYVNDALDLNPYDFYSRGADSSELRALLQATNARPAAAEIGTIAAARGLRIATFALPGEGTNGLEYAPDEDTPVGFRIRLGGGGGNDAETETAPRLFETDDDSWSQLSDASAGAVIGKPVGRRGRVDTTQDLLQLLRGGFFTQVPKREGADLQVATSRNGWTVASLARVPDVAPRSLAAARLRQAFNNGGESGDDIAIDATLALGTVAGERDAAELRVDLAAFAIDGEQLRSGSPLRLSVAVHTQDDTITIQHYDRVLPAAPTTSAVDSASSLDPLDPLDSSDASDNGVDADNPIDPMIERIPLRLPPAADTVAVIVTDVTGGLWGLAFADIDDQERDAAVAAAEARERPRAISLLPLSHEPKTGKVRIKTEVTDEVSRVLFYLNGRRVGRRSRPPFDADIDFGTRTRTSQLVVAAFDRSGNELDRARMLINEPPQSFWVRITEPDANAFAAGPVEVEAQLKVPATATLKAVDFYWKDRLLETANEPPYRRTVRVPLNEPDGFLRVEARLNDGRIAEDVLVTGQAGFGDTIGVELVELYVVATDRRGKPVRDLQESEFKVIEDGDPQTLESFTAAGNLPLTLGLAIDSSSSLFLKMPEVRRAAAKFVASMRDGKDRAFLVGFGSQASLVRSITGDLGSVERSVNQLEPYGATAVWGAINLSLEQLETVTGRRALVVFYDGDDEDSERDFERSMKLARRARLPVYLIVLNDEAARTSGRSLSSRSFANRLEKIGRVGGGRVYFVGVDDELDPIFESISEELRSHYLLTYYPQLEPGGPLWRPVEVGVERRGIDARTVEGRELEP